MSKSIEIKVPDIGDFKDVPVIEVLVSEGDSVKAEDGLVPQWEEPNWENFNTFRTNAQIEGGGACIPPPPG